MATYMHHLLLTSVVWFLYSSRSNKNRLLPDTVCEALACRS